MDWNTMEQEKISILASQIDRVPCARTATFCQPVLRLRVSEARTLSDKMPLPKNYGRLFIQHLLKAMQLDADKIFRWRLEHKLVQALIFNHYCPGVVPVTRGLEREVSGQLPHELLKRVEELRDTGVMIKAALGEGSGEMRQTDQFKAVAEEFAAISSVVCPELLSDERFILQERLQIQEEYRVHSIEDRIVPSLTFLRYQRRSATLDERIKPNAFVQEVLDSLPNAIVAHSLYGWDIALTSKGDFKVIEANPTGIHPVFNPGFQCSGFFQIQSWAPPAISKLLQFISRRYGIQIQIELDVDRISPEGVAYWWIARCKELLDLASSHWYVNNDKSEGLNTDIDTDIIQTLDSKLSAEQNIFTWALSSFHCLYNNSQAHGNKTSSYADVFEANNLLSLPTVEPGEIRLDRENDHGLEPVLKQTDSREQLSSRIETDRIENILVQHPAIYEAAVVSGETAPGVRRSIAYFIRKPNMVIDLRDLRDYLKQNLQGYLIPTSLVMLGELPRLSNGELDRSALLFPRESLGERQRPYIGPRTSTEKAVATIWTALFSLDSVGIDDDFVELGGDSILATQCINRVRHEFTVELPLMLFFTESASVREVARIIDELRASNS
jgi:acyl carrier protein